MAFGSFGTFGGFDAFDNPLLAPPPVAPALRAANAIKPSPQPAPYEPSLLEQIGGMGLSGLEIAGNLLDTGGGVVRNILSLRNPLAGLNPADAGDRATGRDVLETWGLAGPNDPNAWEAADVAGFGVELLTDPLTYVGLPLGATTKAGQAAVKAGPAMARMRSAADTSADAFLAASRGSDDAAKIAQKTLADAGDDVDVARRTFLETTPESLKPRLSDQIRAGQASLSEWNPLGLGDYLPGGRVPLGTGERAAKFAENWIDTPYEKIGNLGLVRAASRALSPAVKGALQPDVAKLNAEVTSPVQDVLTQNLRGDVTNMKHIAELGDLSDDQAEAVKRLITQSAENKPESGFDALPSLADWDDASLFPDPASAERYYRKGVGVGDLIRNSNREFMEAAQDLGVDINELVDPYASYAARIAEAKPAPTGFFNAVKRHLLGTETTLGKHVRSEIYKGVPGGQTTINDIATDPRFFGSDALDEADAAETIFREYFRGGTWGSAAQQEELRAKAGDLLQHLRARPEAEQLRPVYKLDPIEAFGSRIKEMARVRSVGEGVEQLIKRYAEHDPTGTKGVPVPDLLRRLGASKLTRRVEPGLPDAIDPLTAAAQGVPGQTVRPRALERAAANLSNKFGQEIDPDIARVLDDLEADAAKGLPPGAPRPKLSEYVIPAEIADEATRLLTAWTSPQETKSLAKAYDSMLNAYRGSLTQYFPAFAGRNFTDGLARIVASTGEMNPAKMFAALRGATELAAGGPDEFGILPTVTRAGVFFDEGGQAFKEGIGGGADRLPRAGAADPRSPVPNVPTTRPRPQGPEAPPSAEPTPPGPTTPPAGPAPTTPPAPTLPKSSDPLLEQATALVRSRGKATAGQLQSSLGIPSARAEALLDALTAEGVLGPATNKKGREVLPFDPASQPAAPTAPPKPSAKSPIEVNGLPFVPKQRAKANKSEIVLADISKLDKALALDPDFYVGPGGSGQSAVAGRYKGFGDWVTDANKHGRKGAAIEMPELEIGVNGQPSVKDGRHRLAWFRDQGWSHVPVTVEREVAEQFAKEYGFGNAPIVRRLEKPKLPPVPAEVKNAFLEAIEGAVRGNVEKLPKADKALLKRIVEAQNPLDVFAKMPPAEAQTALRRLEATGALRATLEASELGRTADDFLKRYGDPTEGKGIEAIDKLTAEQRRAVAERLASQQHQFGSERFLTLADRLERTLWTLLKGRARKHLEDLPTVSADIPESKLVPWMKRNKFTPEDIQEKVADLKALNKIEDDALKSGADEDAVRLAFREYSVAADEVEERLARLRARRANELTAGGNRVIPEPTWQDAAQRGYDMRLSRGNLERHQQGRAVAAERAALGKRKNASPEDFNLPDDVPTFDATPLDALKGIEVNRPKRPPVKTGTLSKLMAARRAAKQLPDPNYPGEVPLSGSPFDEAFDPLGASDLAPYGRGVEGPPEMTNPFDDALGIPPEPPSSEVLGLLEEPFDSRPGLSRLGVKDYAQIAKRHYLYDDRLPSGGWASGKSWKDTAQMYNPLNTAGVGDIKDDGFVFMKGSRRGNQAVDDVLRTAHAILLKQQGWTDSAIAAELEKWHFDYSKMTDFNRNVTRRIFPFASFMTKNAALAFNELPKNAHRYAAPVRALTSGVRQEEDGPYVPGYLRETLSLPLGADAEGKQVYATSLGLGSLEEPFSRFVFDESGLPNLPRTIDKHVAAMAPPFRIAYEGIGNRSVVTGRPLDETTPNPLIAAAIDDPAEAGGWTRLVGNTPLSRVATTAGKLADDRGSVFTDALNLLTGVRTQTVDSDAAMQRDAMRAIEDQLGSAPHVRESANYYVPESLEPFLTEEERRLMELQQQLIARRRAAAKARQAAEAQPK